MTNPGEEPRRPHLGIVDWGIGGLDLRRRVGDTLPGLAITYWSDSGAPPYGTLSPRQLADRLVAVVAQLVAQGCSEVVLACNAASSALDHLSGAAIPVSGVIDAGVASVPDAADLVGIVGGAATIRSGRHRRRLARPGRQVRGRIAQPLSAHIEAGRHGLPVFREDLRRIVEPLRRADVVVLACTHYPAATDAFADALPGVTLIDPIDRCTAELVARLGPHAPAGSDVPRPVLTTGDPLAMAAAAHAAWGISDLAVHSLPDTF